MTDTVFNKLPALWHRAPRRWGHPLHSLCSYFAMFPPRVPHVFIDWLTSTGDVVYDPFSGRGTAPLEACRMGRVGIGSDANPLAYLLTSAKVDPPILDAVTKRLTYLKKHQRRRTLGNRDEPVAMLYSPDVLRQLCWLRTELDLGSRTDRFIMASILGLMHANYAPGSPARGLSISMPNTFSMSPNYVKRYIRKHDLRPPDVDVFEMIAAKASRMSLPDAKAVRGHAWLGDARSPRALTTRARLMFTSPPYLSVIKYGKYNWIRLWMLQSEASTVDRGLTATASLTKYLTFMSEFLSGASTTLADDGYLCMVIGDVKGATETKASLNLARAVWDFAAKPAGWRRLAMVNDQLPEEHKVSRIWGKAKRGHATKVDRILVLAPPNSRHDLPRMGQPGNWEPGKSWVSGKGGR